MRTVKHKNNMVSPPIFFADNTRHGVTSASEHKHQQSEKALFAGI